MMAIGQVLMEEAPIADGGMAARRFGDYPTPSLADAPDFEIAIIDNPTIAPAGVGETALIAAVPALANAIRDATGYRPARLPVRFDEVSRSARGSGWGQRLMKIHTVPLGFDNCHVLQAERSIWIDGGEPCAAGFSSLAKSMPAASDMGDIGQQSAGISTGSVRGTYP